MQICFGAWRWVCVLWEGGGMFFATHFWRNMFGQKTNRRPPFGKGQKRRKGELNNLTGKKLEKRTAKRHAKRDSIMWRIFNVNSVLSVCALIIWKMFCCHIDSKIKCKVSACFFDTTTYSKMSIILLKKQSRKAACDPKITVRKPPMTCTSYILADFFPSVQWEVDNDWTVIEEGVVSKKQC